jgi:hypothetical protein
MLLDARHRPWIHATAWLTVASAAVYVPYHLRSVNGPGGGTAVGLSFGIAAFALMLFAGLLGARRRVPSWRIGRPEHWMRGHLWLGLLTVPLTLLHAGFRTGGALTVSLLVLLGLVTVSGILGVILQQILPRVMTARAPMETIYEEIGHVLAQLRAEADQLVSAVAGPLGVEAPPAEPVTVAAAQKAARAGTTPASKTAPPASPVEGSLPLKEFYLGRVRPFLGAGVRGSPFANPLRASAAFSSTRMLLPPALHELLKDLEVMCEERRQIAAQERIHRWLHGWLLVHIPLSYSLLLLVAVHAFQSVKY